MRHPRVLYLIAIAVTIALGLGSRVYSGHGAAFIHTYVGDVLYATMYYWIFRWLFPNDPALRAASWALQLCFLIEVGQLYHADWIENLRNTRLGGLVLGFGFLWSDLVCYTVGVVLGLGLDRISRSFSRE